jgi:DNA-binding transcriptional ArsR family regulator
MADSNPPLSAPPLPLAPLLPAIGDSTRWAILGALSEGEPLMVIELAGRLQRSPTVISKHLAVLRKAGAVEIGRGHLYQIPAPYLKDRCLVDYGHCLLRLGSPADAGK